MKFNFLKKIWKSFEELSTINQHKIEIVQNSLLMEDPSIINKINIRNIKINKIKFKENYE